MKTLVGATVQIKVGDHRGLTAMVASLSESGWYELVAPMLSGRVWLPRTGFRVIARGALR